jgi:acyl carrier protein
MYVFTTGARHAAGGCICKAACHRYSLRSFEPRKLEGLNTRSGQVDFMEDIEQKVIEIVSEQMGVDKSEITRETHFINDLNADSLDTVELVMEFEDEFELSIPDEEAEKIQTVGQAIDYIKSHSAK